MNTITLQEMIDRAALSAEAAAALNQAAATAPADVAQIIENALQEYRQNTDFPFESYRLQLEEKENAVLWIMLYVFRLAEHLHELYLSTGRGEELFDNILRDFAAKVRECYDYTGSWGIHVAKWYNGWFDLTRVAFSRLQFEVRPFRNHYGDMTPEDLVINVHIPSIGPLDPQLCEADYRRAAEFFGEHFGDRVPFICHTWLLNPDHPKFLPSTSRLLPFQAKYDIFKFEEHTNFLWRLFGTAYTGDPHDLTERNSLERAYKNWLLAGGRVGEGVGIFFYDKQK